MRKKYKVWWYWNTKKYKFHQNKTPILIDNIDINKVVVCNKFSFGKKKLNILLAVKMKN